VEAGSRARVRFPFQLLLVPGTYFLNAGVLGLREGGEEYLHRILDAVMVRVEPEGRTRITGQVDLSGAQAVAVEIAAPARAVREVAGTRSAG
jgi:lipopolysaccharide transport system ATP-binding protein